MEVDKAAIVSQKVVKIVITSLLHYYRIYYANIFQLAQDIFVDLRDMLQQVRTRSSKRRLRHPQTDLENTLEQALGN